MSTTPEYRLERALARYVKTVMPTTAPGLDLTALARDLAKIIDANIFGTDLSVYIKEEA